MPCESIVLNQVHLGLANKELLAAALKDIGASVHGNQFCLEGYFYAIDATTGELKGPAALVGAVADRIKQAYSAQAIQKAAKRFGWTTKKTAGNKFAIKRG